MYISVYISIFIQIEVHQRCMNYCAMKISACVRKFINKICTSFTDVFLEFQLSNCSPIPAVVISWLKCLITIQTCHQGIFWERGHSINIFLVHFSKIVKQIWQGFQNTILNIQFWPSVFVHKSWQHREQGACLCYNSDGHGCANLILTFSDFQIIQQCSQYIMRNADRREETSTIFVLKNELIALYHINVQQWIPTQYCFTFLLFIIDNKIYF